MTRYPQTYPLLPPDFNALSWTTLDKKKAGTLAMLGFTGLVWTSLDVVLVEVAGVEPASEGA